MSTTSPGHTAFRQAQGVTPEETILTILNRLSIRSYTRRMRSHFHEYHQLVLPLRGSINIKVGDYSGKVILGDCVIIKAGQRHDFHADEAARFLVSDLEQLPANITETSTAKFSISPPLLAYIQFVDKQLESQVNQGVETMTFDLFCQLIAQQACCAKIDPRIERVIEVIQHDLSHTSSIQELAQHACLSPTQFKKVFKQSMVMTTQQYVTRLRMEKAKALLAHTDLPIRIVAEQVGYTDLSAFSRRFSEFFGLSPTAFSR